MAKFNRNSRSREGAKGEEEKKGGRSAYKAKRSFTRNKSSRDKEKSQDKGDRPWRKDDRPFRERPAFRDRPRAPRGGEETDREKRGTRPDEKREDRKPFPGRDKRKDSWSKGSDEGAGHNERRPYRGRGEDEDQGEKRGFGGRDRKETGDRERRPFSRDREGSDERKPLGRNSRGEEREREPRERGKGERSSPRKGRRDEKPYSNHAERASSERGSSRPEERDRPARRSKHGDDDGPRRVRHDDFEEGRTFSRKKPAGDERKKPAKKTAADDGLIRLNKYLSNAGIASRREADTLIQSGAVKVNGEVVSQLGYKIKAGDKVTYGDESVRGERKVYLLLNKPKDYITTVDDPRERKTVMELVEGACRERIYPVGRLDRNTTGLLLFTNDGELTTRLTHPKYNVKKVYHVTLDKNLKTTDFKALTEGIELEDGPAKADDLAFVGEGKREVGIEIHSGRNRIVRRMFEQLGYQVLKLDRVVFAGLTKKDLPRGKHRFLTPREVAFLKMIG